jgi:hypothetical protein
MCGIDCGRAGNWNIRGTSGSSRLKTLPHCWTSSPTCQREMHVCTEWRTKVADRTVGLTTTFELRTRSCTIETGASRLETFAAVPDHFYYQLPMGVAQHSRGWTIEFSHGLLSRNQCCATDRVSSTNYLFVNSRYTIVISETRDLNTWPRRSALCSTSRTAWS